MPKRKLDDSKLEELVSFILEKDTYMDKEYYKNGYKEIGVKFDISTPTITIYIRKLLSKGLLTEEERKEWIHDSGMRIIKIKHEKYGPDLFSQMMSDAREKGMGSDPERLVSAAIAGGLATQKKHPHVLENLTNAVPFGSNEKSYFGELIFGSKEERLIGLVLQEYGLLKLENGVTLQRNVGRKKADFYINDKLIVEYHTSTKDHSEVAEESEQEYLNRRINELEPEFRGKVIVLSKTAAYHFYEKLTELGITDTYEGVNKKFKNVKEELERYDAFMKDDYTEMDKPAEEDVI